MASHVASEPGTPAGLRAGVLTACPTDGRLGTEVRLLADALTVDGAEDPAEHLPAGTTRCAVPRGPSKGRPCVACPMRCIVGEIVEGADLVEIAERLAERARAARGARRR
jgi:hypothetical protein